MDSVAFVGRKVFFIFYRIGSFLHKNKSVYNRVFFVLLVFLVFRLSVYFSFPDDLEDLYIDNIYVEKYESAGGRQHRTGLYGYSIIEQKVVIYNPVDNLGAFMKAKEDKKVVEIGWSYRYGLFVAEISGGVFDRRTLLYAKVDDVPIVDFNEQISFYGGRYKSLSSKDSLLIVFVLVFMFFSRSVYRRLRD